MSNIGKKFIKLPHNINLLVKKNTFGETLLTLTGPLGSETFLIPRELELIVKENSLNLEIKDGKITNIKSKRRRNLIKDSWGTLRTKIQNCIRGITQGFVIRLNLIGVGYRAFLQEKTNEANFAYLQLKLGYSHLILLKVPSTIKIQCPKPATIILRGIDLDLLTQFAAVIRAYKKPEPFKGKGILYKGEKIKLKEGKKK